MTEPSRRAAVIGHPISHSLSPVLHRAAYRELGLTTWLYDVVDVAPEYLGEFMSALDGSWTGLSVTMPHKRTIASFVDQVEPLAAAVGSINTVVFSGGDSKRPGMAVGANTDVHGMVAAITERLPAGLSVTAPTGAILGGGATAASALAALGGLGCTRPVVYVRSKARSGEAMRAAHNLGVEPRWRSLSDAAETVDADITISTIPAMADIDPILQAIVRRGSLKRVPLLLDVVYDPWPTKLAESWPGQVISGHRMLLHQAALQVQLMTGKIAPIETMRKALNDAGRGIETAGHDWDNSGRG